MRAIIIGLVVFLSACNQDNDAALQASNNELQTQITDLQNQVKALPTLQAKIAEDEDKLSNLQIIGKFNAEHGNELAVNDGPCPTMGVFQGRGGSDTTNPLLSQFEIYKTVNCVGIDSGVYTSYNDVTGLHDVPPYVAWDGPDCTGNMYIETDVPQNTYPDAVLKGGIVFTSPIDGLAYWLKGNQTPQSVFIQSAINTRPGGNTCESDQETRMVDSAVINDVMQSGVHDSLVPGSWTQASP